MKHSIPEMIIANFEQQLELQILLQTETSRLRMCILKRQLEDISGVTHRMDEIAGKMETLELDRRQVILQSGFSEEAARSFDTLVRVLPEEVRQKLLKLRQQLKTTARETYRLTAGNRILLEEALSSVKSTVAILTRSARASTGYDYNGQISSVNRKKLLNRVG